ncbi:hypothetical protein FQA39_LY12886 [Lamprigera yunnana]|nr:hypothetical protein FQA39_LY12886 [Lamprigera yunnana]
MVEEQLAQLLSKVLNVPPFIIKPIIKQIIQLVSLIKDVNINFKLVDKDNNEIQADNLGFNKSNDDKQFKAGVKTNVMGFDVESEKNSYATSEGTKEYYGNNYAIGGAKASKTDGAAGSVY